MTELTLKSMGAKLKTEWKFERTVGQNCMGMVHRQTLVVDRRLIKYSNIQGNFNEVQIWQMPRGMQRVAKLCLIQG